jgi:hypothetical protein
MPIDSAAAATDARDERLGDRTIHSPVREELDGLVTASEDPTTTPRLETSDRAFLQRTFRSLLSRLPGDEGPARGLHGNPEGTRIAVNGHVVWVDLEAVCLGPLGWDLSPLDDEDAAPFGEADLELLAQMRDLRGCRVAALCWMRPGRAPAVDEAAAWHLDRVSPRPDVENCAPSRLRPGMTPTTRPRVWSK